MGLKDCPSRNSLDRWALGDLADDEADTIAGHLDTCADCEQAVADFEGAGFLAAVGETAEATRFAQEVQCEAFIGTLQDLGPRTRATYSESLGHDQWVGRRIRDYQLLARLGQGAMGAVYEARHIRLNKRVAIKLLTEKLDDNPAAIARFQREMQAVGVLEHPNIVQALDAGEANGISFLVMELIDGIDLAKLTFGGRRLEMADACEIARQVAVGLQYAHSQGLVHRDIKPSNLMLTRDADGCPRVKILDLGLATIEGLDTHQHLTDDGQLMGTLEFMAPEQAEDTRSVDYRADLYSLGATLFRLLTGSVPFTGPEFNTPVKRLKALTHSTPPSIANRRHDLPAELVRLVDRLLARQPDERPRDMSEVVSQLVGFAADHRLADHQLADHQLADHQLADHQLADHQLADHQLADHQLADHQLARVLERGTRERNQTSPALADSSAALLDTTPSLGATVEMPFRDHEVVTSSASPLPALGARRRRRLRLLLVGLPMAALLLGTIWIQTDGGYIRIEAVDPSIEVSVEIFKDKRHIDTVEVGAGGGRCWYRSGSYEVRFPIGAEDGLEIAGSEITLTRGGERAVTISRLAIAAEQPSVPSEYAEPTLLVVTTIADDVNVPGSLREAIAKAVTGGTIGFDPVLAGQTIVLNGTPLVITTDITIDAENLKAAITIDGNGLSRVFDLENRRKLKILGMRITGGKDYAPGGGISVKEATLTMTNCVISNGSSPTDGGGIYCANGNVTLENCLIANNSAGQLGGGMANYGGTCLLKNCIFTKNSSGRGHGAAILNVDAGRMELIHCTVAGNVNSGIFSHRWATLILDSSIVSDNDHLDDGGNKDVWIQPLDGGGIVARGVNIIEKLGANVKSGPEPIIGNAMLALLGDYGGPFAIMPPLPASPAIDAAVSNESTPAADIRGVSRPLDGNGDGDALPDIGAIEFDPDHDRMVRADLSTRDQTAAVPLPTRNLPDLTKLPAGKVRVFGTANQPMEIGAAAEIADFVEVQLNSNIGWFGLRRNGDVMRWHVEQGAEEYRQGQNVRVLNRTAATSYGNWLSGDGKIIQRGHQDLSLMADAPQSDIVDLARSYPTDDWTVLTADGRLQYIGTTEFPPPMGVTDFVRIGNWHDHHIGIRENGRLVVWGRDPAPLPDLSGLQFAKIRSNEFYSLLLTTQGTLVHLTKGQIVELPEELDRHGWVDIACGNFVFAARQADGHWHAWGDPLAGVVAKINSLGANVPSLSMTKDAAVWIEME